MSLLRATVCLCLLLGLAVAAPPLELDAEGFKQAMAEEEPVFVKFFAPWCGHCKRLAPTWDELAEKFTDAAVKIAKVDCTAETALCAEHEVRGYPTLKLFLVGGEVKDYKGSRDITSLSDFVTANTEAAAQEQETKDDVKEGAAGAGGVEVDAEGVVHLTDSSFKTYLKTKPGVHFVKFFAPWCGHCQRLAPVWSQLAEHFKTANDVHIIKVDCTEETETCQQNGVKGYPTLVLFEDGLSIDKYSGARTLEALVDFVDANVPDNEEEEEEEEGGEVKREAAEQEEEAKGVVELTADTFPNAIATGVTFVKFFAPWCGHCKRLAPTWDELAEKAHRTLPSVTIAKVDCTAHKEVCSGEGVTGYPTLVLFAEGEKRQEYRQARDLDTLYSFVEEHSH